MINRSLTVRDKFNYFTTQEIYLRKKDYDRAQGLTTWTGFFLLLYI